MLRILFALALGGAISLIILSTTGSTQILPWAIGFIIAAVVLFFERIFGGILRRSRKVRKEVLEAKEHGRVRAALILGRSQTGLYVNEQPQVEFTLLVDRPGKKPFVTTAREVVAMIDLHEVVPGSLVTVAHPDSEYEHVHILRNEKTPTPSRELTTDLVSDAVRLPKREASGLSSTLWITVGAFVVGFVGTPFLATPTPWQYVEYLLGDKSSSVARLDHPFLFETDELISSLDGMTAQLGQNEVRSLRVTDVRITAEVPTSPGSRQTDRVTVQDYEIIEQEPHDTLPPEFTEEFAGGLVDVFDIDWGAVLERAPEAAELVKAQGLHDPELQAISVQQDNSSLAPIEVRMDFRDDYSTGQVFLTATGELAASEEFSLLTEEERAVYFYDAERFVPAVRKMLDEVGTEEIIEIGNYGDRLYLDVFIDQGSGIGQRVHIGHREGRIADVEAPEPDKVAPDDRFKLEDLDWVRVYDRIEEGQRIMAEAGAEGTEPTHILIRRDSMHSRETNETYARIYLRNAYDESGYVVVYGDGTIGRVSEP